MFAGKGLQLPFLTRVLMIGGESVQHFWWAYIAGVAATIVCARRAWRTSAGQAVMDRFFHRLPVINRILQGLAISRFARVFGLSLASGIGLLEALEMGGRSSGRPMLQADTQKLIEQVRKGGRLCDVLPSCTYFPTFAKRLIAAGEQSGELSKMCDTVARQFERETSMLTKNIGVVIEPVLVVLIAGVVLMVALAIFLPMWDLVRIMG
ncbi:MAG: type II secretion system F family protein [Pyrinomonadaceae bacterium]|nr:type II secretion system F family protein [Phycisphaerales bacterium]